MEIPETYLWSADPNSAELFELECKKAANVAVRTRLDDRTYLVNGADGFRPLFGQHRFPLQAEAEISAQAVDWATSLPRLRIPRGMPYGFQLRANRRLPWGFAELIEAWSRSLKLDPGLRQDRRPRTVISAYAYQDGDTVRFLAGQSLVEDNVSPWAGGVCRIPADPASVSRAEQKLLEAWELFELMAAENELTSPGPAVDLGAAPGGWSRVAAGLGYSVEAVDPAPLDPVLKSYPGITHFPVTSGDFLKKNRGPYRLLLCDMKMEALMASALVSEFAHRLLPGARLVVTLKLPKKGLAALDVARRSVAKLGEIFEILVARQLYFNRSEITVLARKRPEE